MKRSVLLLWLLIGTAFGQTEEENKAQLEKVFKGFPSQAKSTTSVTAGVGIGKIVLGKTPAQIQDVLGTPEKCDTTMSQIRMVYHNKNGFDILFYHSRAVEIRFNKGCEYKLEPGVGIGSSPNKVFKT